MAENDLSNEIQMLLTGEVDNELVRKLCRFLQHDKKTGDNYRPVVINRINNGDILDLFEEMRKNKEIEVSKNDYKLLIRVLRGTGQIKFADELEELIEEHICKPNYQPVHPESGGRPNNLPVRTGVRKHSFMERLSPLGVRTSDEITEKRPRNFSQASGSSTDTVFADGMHKYYKMASNMCYEQSVDKRGLVVIVNNFTDSQKELYRNGTVEDERRIQELFSGPEFCDYYEVIQKRDLDIEGFKALLKELHCKLNTKRYQRFIFFILSHGDEKGVNMYYENQNEPTPENSQVKVEDIMDEFKKSLPGFPKIFVIQACQGTEDNTLVTPDTIIEGSHQVDDGGTEVVSDVITINTKVPEYADMLTAFATVRGHRSYRRGKNWPGSWYIQHLTELISGACKPIYYSTHLLDLLTEVQNQVMKEKGHMEKEGEKIKVRQMPCFESSLTKKFYFLPRNFSISD